MTIDNNLLTKDDILKELKYYHRGGFKYIARDKKGTLYLYRDEPHKEYACMSQTSQELNYKERKKYGRSKTLLL